MLNLPTFEDFLNESYLISEIGEGTKPFKWYAIGSGHTSSSLIKQMPNNGKWSDDIEWNYEIKGDKATYSVTIKTSVQTRLTIFPKPGIKPKVGNLNAGIGFDVKGSEEEETTNFNEQYRLISTVTEIVLNYIQTIESDFNVNQIWIVPKADKGEKQDTSNKRGKFYEAYIKKQIGRLKKPYTVMKKILPNVEGKVEGFVISSGHWSGQGQEDWIKNPK